jgi:uncharacterized membrane protein
VPEIPRKIVVALVLIFSVWLMIQGYGAASAEVLWVVPNVVRLIAIILMVAAFIIYAGSYPGSAIMSRIRHPQLTGFKLWALIHLIVNGDVRSVILFGGLLVWAIVQVIILNRASGKPPLSAPADSALKAWMSIPIGLTAWVVLFLGHAWLFGVSPLG